MTSLAIETPVPKLAFDYLPLSAAAVIHSPLSKAYVWRPAKGVVVSRVEGYFSEEAATLLDTKVRSCVADHGSVLGIHDWWEATDYATSARTRLTTLAVDLRRASAGINIIVQSRLVALAVQTANLAVRNITVYPDRDAFERFLVTTVRSRAH